MTATADTRTTPRRDTGRAVSSPPSWAPWTPP